MGSSGDVAMEGKMAGVIAGVQGIDLEKGGKRGSDCSMEGCYDSTPIFPLFLTHVTSHALSFPCRLPRAPSMCLQVTGFIFTYVALMCIILFAHALVWFLMAVPWLLITFL